MLHGQRPESEWSSWRFLELHIASYHAGGALPPRQARPHETAAVVSLASRNKGGGRNNTHPHVLELTLMGLRARWRCPEGAGATSRLDPRRAKRCRAALGGRSPGAIPGKLSGHLPSDNHVTHPSSRIQLTAILTGAKY